MNNLIELINRKNVLIFDFDGVLADSVEVKTEAFSELYTDYGVKIQARIIEHHRANGGMSRFEKFKHYHEQFLGKNLSENEMKALSSDFSNLVLDKVIQSPEISGALDFIKYFSGKKKFAINSATPEDEIKLIAKKRGIQQYFSVILGSPHSKTENLQKIVSFFAVKKEQCLFFGDADSDYCAAQQAKIDFVGLATGKQKCFPNAKFIIQNFKLF